MLSDSIRVKLEQLYPQHSQEQLLQKIESIVLTFKTNYTTVTEKRDISENDVFLITYGDSLLEEGKQPLEVLNDFLQKYLKGLIPNVHILPFYPYSSDDGFSVIDYYEVNQELGDWEHIQALSENVNLMFDGVINHISSQSEWFQKYLLGEDFFSNFFIEMDPSVDLSQVTRPRALPLLSPYETQKGEKYIWTTFSRDQIDLNFSNPEVFLEVLRLIFFYISKGAAFLRLDAIGFLWKRIGTCCIHLPETHAVIQVYRELIEIVRKDFQFITETNVPHEDNVSYFGDGYNEASMVYQFPLPPLVLHSILNNDCSYLSKWASTLILPSNETGFFNFLASHDGIGLNPARGILPEVEILNMAALIEKRGGYVSNKKNSDGSESPYELNISLYNALSDESEEEEVRIEKFLLAHAIQLSLVGTPAIYIHSLLGSQNYVDGVKQTGRYRSINREKLDYGSIQNELGDSTNRRSRIFRALSALIAIRKGEKAFHPNQSQEILEMGKDILAIKRGDVLCLFNMTVEKQIAQKGMSGYKFNNLLKDDKQKNKIELKPYGFGWFKMEAIK